VSRADELALVGRDPEKLATAARELASGTRSARISTHRADLSLLADVRRLAGELADSTPSANVLVNNAGALFSHREVTSEGIERTFALNVLSPFLLTRLLHDRLRQNAPARVVMVASAAHVGNKLHLDDLEGRAKYSGYAAYGRSKLALILLTHEFARRWKPDGISVNAVHPGFVRSGFGHNNGGGTSAAIRFLALFALSATKGATTPVYVATSPQVEGTTGEYFAKSRVLPSSPESYDEAIGRKLWDICSEKVGLPP
ncbi:MAG TPA: SDR family NAD(P)-dependent oxidoreductase, partial [Thermoplasmata archaeon]|nr:SDR family NAD(P)-dependent oxidoreductase [Thermoplasmata archaeon]